MTHHAPPYMEWYPRDIISDPAYVALPHMARLLYRHLIDAQWICGGVLPADEKILQHYAMFGEADFEAYAPMVLKPPYFLTVEGGWSNERVARDYAKAIDRRTVAAEKAKKAATARWSHAPSIATSNAPAMPTQHSALSSQLLASQLSASQLSTEKDSGEVSPDPSCSTGGSNGAVKRSRKRKPYPPEFEAFWEHYPRRSGKEDAAKAFLEAAGRPGVTAAALAERSTAFGEALGNGLAPGAPLAGTWLRAGRYGDNPDEWIRMACRTLRLPDPTFAPVRSKEDIAAEARAKRMAESAREYIEPRERPALSDEARAAIRRRAGRIS